MKLSITESALEKINKINQANHTYILLRYDTKGMGCAVSGLPTFSLISERENRHIDVENEQFPTLITEVQAVFFAENMKLDYINGMFRLSSPEGILNPFIPTVGILE
ncbi:iron-sulfur cluster biosynthesis family protein [Ornithinibacillus xuwenensis]|uniref:Iron-sulfur cluster biosynthesis family protein n=1 Tax=Ornithinibacillus xuwenensis TaxID=3144668 RepID=A0ABU9XDG3_9BACI